MRQFLSSLDQRSTLSATFAVVLLSIQPAPACSAEPPAPVTAEMASFSWLKKNVFRSCAYCHTERQPHLLNHKSAMTAVIPGDPAGSRLYQMVASGKMPPGPRLSDEKISAIYWWIFNGAEDN